MTEESHRALKRWERARQLEGLEARPEAAGPLAWCRVRSAAGNRRLPVHLLALFAGDFAYVSAAGESVPEGVPGTAWVTRGGIEWNGYLRAVLRQYSLGRPVPKSFAPIRKFPSELLGRLERLPDAALPEIFAKLRAEGLLPALRPLSRETCPAGLPWEDMRARFQDFARDIPPR
jgi:hypothetical protein